MGITRRVLLYDMQLKLASDRAWCELFKLPDGAEQFVLVIVEDLFEALLAAPTLYNKKRILLGQEGERDRLAGSSILQDSETEEEITDQIQYTANPALHGGFTLKQVKHFLINLAAIIERLFSSNDNNVEEVPEEIGTKAVLAIMAIAAHNPDEVRDLLTKYSRGGKHPLFKARDKVVLNCLRSPIKVDGVPFRVESLCNDGGASSASGGEVGGGGVVGGSFDNLAEDEIGFNADALEQALEAHVEALASMDGVLQTTTSSNEFQSLELGHGTIFLLRDFLIALHEERSSELARKLQIAVLYVLQGVLESSHDSCKYLVEVLHGTGSVFPLFRCMMIPGFDFEAEIDACNRKKEEKKKADIASSNVSRSWSWKQRGATEVSTESLAQSKDELTSDADALLQEQEAGLSGIPKSVAGFVAWFGDASRDKIRSRMRIKVCELLAPIERAQMKKREKKEATRKTYMQARNEKSKKHRREREKVLEGSGDQLHSYMRTSIMRNHRLFSQLRDSRTKRTEGAKERWHHLQNKVQECSRNHKRLIERVNKGGVVAVPLKVKGGQDERISKVLATDSSTEERSPLQRFYAAASKVTAGIDSRSSIQSSSSSSSSSKSNSIEQSGVTGSSAASIGSILSQLGRQEKVLERYNDSDDKEVYDDGYDEDIDFAKGFDNGTFAEDGGRRLDEWELACAGSLRNLV